MPPDTFADNDPFVNPKQLTFVGEVFNVMGLAALMVNDALDTHPEALVTVVV